MTGGWQGGYEPRMAKKRYCPDCWAVYYNFHAHAEECPGPVRVERKPCCVLVPVGLGSVRVPCSKPAGHSGGHTA